MRGTSRLLIGLDAYSTGGNSLLLLETHQKPVAGEGTGLSEKAIALSCWTDMMCPSKWLRPCPFTSAAVSFGQKGFFLRPLTVTAETHNIKMLINNCYQIKKTDKYPTTKETFTAPQCSGRILEERAERMQEPKEGCGKCGGGVEHWGRHDVATAILNSQPRYLWMQDWA